MADLLTVYDDGESNTFIDCTICDKRIRGDTNYKIHLTTLQHLKRERTLADKGLIPEPTPLPQWANIKDYLTYLNLSEPIIGLGDLVQEDDFFTNDGRALLRYRCRLCTVQMDLYDMATHVVGRRHRQKYLERHRPDLVTWEKTSEKQAGVVARAKAAIVEKQEGWGTPVPLIRSDKGRSLRNRGAAQDPPSYVQGRASSGRDRREQDLYNQSYMEGGDAYGRPSCYREDNQYDQSYRDDGPHHPSGSGDNQYDAPYSQGDRQRRSYGERDYMERPHWEDEMNIGAFQGDGTHDRRYTEKGVPQPYDDDWHPETNPSRGPYKSRESDDYYHGNISENRFGESGMGYQESGRMQEPTYTSHHGTGPSMDERQRQSRNMPYTEKGRERFQDMNETGRHGSFEMQGYNKTQRYYPSEDAIPAKKKRKSRFSDASPLEMALARKSQIDDMISKYKQKGRMVPTNNQASGNSMDSAVTPRMENVLDVLNDIQIENVEEANFLKDKLCTLLKEFQSNKVQRSQGQVSQTSIDFTDSYHGGNKMEQRRDMPESRRLDVQGFQEPARYDRDLLGPREYLHTRHVEDPKSMRQNRGPEEPEYQWDPYREGSAGRSEERMPRHPDDRRGYREGAWNSRPLREEERVYVEERHYQHDYRSGGDLYDPFEPSSSPPLETGSSTLDKLASTLLELVARKTN
ncbi:uncharacterized protein si:ch211-13c6.2 isoform X1 [Pangasianodon hypophthalmus]|uniref:uncharacterized protein si:ch211-13c6.2 isoform X1 n=2 Tax=Pangasianodon hypophthalmus TaxID=310915 RepID=UPI000EFEA5EB|nr:uncharacterized protein si:ch211-13c6.2 isoform X1 [Pangasianodon hypophthalmus]XP_026785388.3 uncharacterized protein si:ch211-13c6.2 isoform X1 [Pangasianodon hypophthalmus]